MVVFFLLPLGAVGQDPVAPDATPATGKVGPALQLMATGKAALDDGFYELAEKQFRICLDLAGKDTGQALEVRVLLARALYGQKKYDEMLDLLSGTKTGEGAFWQAMAYYGMNEYRKALGSLRTMIEENPNAAEVPKAMRLQSHCYLKTGKTNEALVVFAEVEEHHKFASESAGNLYDWAATLVLLERFEEARRILASLVERFPSTGSGQLGRDVLARLMISDKDYQEAEKVLLPLVRSPDAPAERRAGALCLLGQVYEEQGRFAAATNALHRGIALTANPAVKHGATGRLALLLLEKGKTDEGVKLAKSFISESPQHPAAGELQLALAQAMLESGDAARAAAEYQSYLDTFTSESGAAKALRGKGWALLRLPLPKYAEAAALFEKAYAAFENPMDKARCLFKVADSYFGNRQYKLAADTYGRVVSEFPESSLLPDARFQVAESLARDEQLEEAEKLLRDLIDMHPGTPIVEQALVRLAELEEQRGAEVAALATYKRVMNSYPDGSLYADALLAHGLISYRRLRFNQALRDFERVVKLAPGTELAERAFYMRGWCDQMMGRETNAVATCEEFCRRFPESRWAPDVMFWIGEYRFNHGDCAGAEKQFVALASAYKESPVAEKALLWAGRSAARQKEFLRATGHYNALVRDYPDSDKLPEARYSQGDAASELGRFSEAILVFEEVIKKYPDNYLVDSAWGRKGDCLFALGHDDTNRYEEAMRAYEVVVGSDSAEDVLKLQATYKIGKCYQRLGRSDEALETYLRVVYTYVDRENEDVSRNPASDTWFTGAAFDAVEILEQSEKWREAVRLLKRVVDSGLPVARDAQERIDKIRLKHWILFY